MNELDELGLNAAIAVPSAIDVVEGGGSDASSLAAFGRGSVATLFKGIDTVVDSVTFGDRGVGKALAYGASEQVGQLYERNEDLLDFTSALAGSVALGVTAPAAVARYAPMAAEVLGGSASVRALLGASKTQKIANALRWFQQPDEVIGVAASPVWSRMKEAAAGGQLISRGAAGAWSAYRGVAAQTLADVAIGEVSAFALMHDSKVFDDFGTGDYFKWIAAGTAISVGARSLQLARSLRQAGEASAELAQSVLNKGAQTGFFASVPDGLRAAIFTDASLNAQTAAGRVPEGATETTRRAFTETNATLTDQFKALAAQSIRDLHQAPVADVVQRKAGQSMSDGAMRAAQQLFESQPSIGAATVRIEEMDTVLETAAGLKRATTAAASKKAKAMAAITENDPASMAKAQAAIRQDEKLRSMDMYVIGRDGQTYNVFRFDENGVRESVPLKLSEVDTISSLNEIKLQGAGKLDALTLKHPNGGVLNASMTNGLYDLKFSEDVADAPVRGYQLLQRFIESKGDVALRAQPALFESMPYQILDAIVVRDGVPDAVQAQAFNIGLAKKKAVLQRMNEAGRSVTEMRRATNLNEAVVRDILKGSSGLVEQLKPRQALANMLSIDYARPTIAAMFDRSVLSTVNSAEARRMQAAAIHDHAIGSVASKTGTFASDQINRLLASETAQTAMATAFLNNESLLGGAASVLQTAGRIGQDSAPVRAASMLDTVLSAATNKFTEELMTPVHTAFEAVAKGKHKDEAALAIDVLQKYVVKEMRRHSDGRVSFLVDLQDQRNAAMYERATGTTIEELFANAWNDEAVDMTVEAVLQGGKPLYVSAPVADFIDSVNSVQQRLRMEHNTLRTAYGLEPVKAIPIHVPSKRYVGKARAFVVGADGRVIGMAAADTQDAAVAQARKSLEVKIADDASLVHATVKSEEELSLSRSLEFDVDWEELVDYSTTGLQRKGQSLRGAKSVEAARLGDEVFREMFASIRDSIRSIDTRTRMLYAKPAFEHAQVMQLAATKKQQSAALDTWLNAYLGRTITTAPTAGASAKAVFDAMDDAVQSGGRVVIDTLERLAELYDPSGERAASRTLASLNKALGPQFTPFKSVEDVLANTYRVKIPGEVRDWFGAANKWVSYLSYSSFRASAALMNVLSVVPMSTAIGSELQKLPNETLGQWQARTGLIGVHTPDGLVVNPYKIGISAMHDLFTKEGKKVVEDAKAMGLLGQTAEVMNLLNQTEYTTSTFEKGLKWASQATYKTEELSRAIGLMAGYRIGQQAGFTREGSIAYGAWVANQVAGDFRASNKPRMFQGAAGMPVGLFTTFMWNVAERCLGWVERGDVRTAARFALVQSTMFGASTLPGYAQFESLMSNYDGSVNPHESIKKHYGEAVADVWSYGTLSNLPKLFGASDGVALNRRGDLNIHSIPNLFNPTGLPAVAVMRDLFTLAKEQMKAPIDASLRERAEIASSYFPNHFIRKMLEQANGYAVDRRGQLLDDNVRTGMKVATNLLSMDSLQQAKLQEMWQREKVREAAQGDRVDELRNNLRREWRANGKLSEKALYGALLEYTKNGGTLEGYRSFLQNTAASALESKYDREFLKALRAGDNVKADRFMSAINGRME